MSGSNPTAGTKENNMGKIVDYTHHGRYVSVDEDLKGKHQEHCLCWRCKWFFPEAHEANCRIANLNFAMCQAFGLVTPVYECPVFVEKK